MLKPPAHGSAWGTHHVGDLPISEPFDIGVVHHRTALLGQGPHRRHDFGVGQCCQSLILSRNVSRRCASCLGRQLVVGDPVHRVLDRSLSSSAVGIDVDVRLDPVEPRPQVAI